MGSSGALAPGGQRQGGSARQALLAAVLSVLLALPSLGGVAAMPLEATALAGFFSGDASVMLRREARLMAIPRPERAERLARALASRPRVAGTDGMAATHDFLVTTLRALGLAVETVPYDVFLPHATGVSVRRLAPTPVDLDLAESVLAADPGSALGAYPAAAGYGAPGRAVGDVVYAHYGRDEDFAILESRGVDVRGRVVVLRLGEIFRGNKVRNAEDRGAVACLLYRDPIDDGFYVGDVYPDGPFRPWSGIERGSVRIGPLAALAETEPVGRRQQRYDARAGNVLGVPSIPVVSISAAAARSLLEPLSGSRAPTGWQGALPFHYHVGPGPSRADVEVVMDDRPVKRVVNVVAWIPGVRYPDEWVVVGAHADAWDTGAVDNGSGTVSLLEAARALAQLANAGAPPRRTIVLAFWDAEEWGLVGSTEWVETHAESLAEGAVAYLNLDGTAGGPIFGAGASPSLKPLVRAVADTVADPVEGPVSVLDAWRRRVLRERPAASVVGDITAGSDASPFFHHLGVASAGFGFSGRHGVYHSAYDTVAFMERFGDPGYLRHTVSASMAAALAWRLANADVIPYDYAGYGRELAVHLSRVAQAFERLGWNEGIRQVTSAWREIEAFRVTANQVDATTARLLSGAATSVTLSAITRANEHLRAVERRLTLGEGIPDRPWVRNVVLAPDRENLYSNTPLPGIVDAIRDGERGRAAAQAGELARAIGAATRELQQAVRELQRATERATRDGRG